MAATSEPASGSDSAKAAIHSPRATRGSTSAFNASLPASVTGPLGIASEVENYGTVLCIGGGVGIAPVFPIARDLKEAGNKVISIIGARNKDLLIMEDKMKAASHELHVCTDDGSYGHHGFVTDVLKKVLETKDVKLVVGIGPVPMMKFVSKLTKEYGVKTLVSLNAIMVDGTGMCGCCRVSVGGKTQFACVDGPEFDGHAVDFDELAQRLDAYKDLEKLAFERYLNECKAR